MVSWCLQRKATIELFFVANAALVSTFLIAPEMESSPGFSKKSPSGGFHLSLLSDVNFSEHLDPVFYTCHGNLGFLPLFI
jgi:hypothetical protein